MSIFKSCDIRGVYGRELDEQTAYHLGRAVATQTRGQTVVVGGDLRLSTPALQAALIQGLLESGAAVVNLGQVPTPAFYFAKHLLNAYGGIMVTASHNPARYNGFKLMLGELPVTPEDVQTLAGVMQRREYAAASGSLIQRDVLPAYVDSLVGAFPDLHARRVVVDAGNGSMGTVAPGVLRRLGQEVDELFCEPDGAFPNRDPNPAVPVHLTALQERVITTDATLGIAYDGDGDRVIFVDERGRVLPADRTLVLMIRTVLRRRPGGKVVYDLKSSSVVADEILAARGVPLMERSGHAFIKHRLLTEGAILGGEISGHYFYGALGGDDALYATLFLLRVLDDLGLTLGQAMDTVPVYPITPDLRLPCPPAEAEAILASLRAAFAAYPISELDGVRIQFPDGWALARLSVTEPLITLRFEAHDAARLAAIQQEVRQAVPALEMLLHRSGL
jgi:phosphomannomutase / phosphoglucomutase